MAVPNGVLVFDVDDATVKLPLRQMAKHKAQTMSGRRESTDQRYKNYSVLLNYLKDRGVNSIPVDLKTLSSGNLV